MKPNKLPSLIVNVNMALWSIISLAALSCICQVYGTPTVLGTVSEIVKFATKGAPLRLSVNVEKCSTAFPPDLRVFGFGEYVSHASINADALRYYRERPTNGSHLGLIGPAARVNQFLLEANGVASVKISDVNTVTDLVVVSGEMTCQLGSGLTVFAERPVGSPVVEFEGLKTLLLSGNRIMYSIDISSCPQIQGPPREQRLDADEVLVGEVEDFRLNGVGDITFTKTVPFILTQPQLVWDISNFQIVPTGNLIVSEYLFKVGQTTTPVKVEFNCTLGVSAIFFVQL